jgi:hypothetical protein
LQKFNEDYFWFSKSLNFDSIEWVVLVESYK